MTLIANYPSKKACKLCGGASVKAKSIAIVAHGTSKRKAKELVS